MEIDFKLTYELPEELCKALNITNETPFETYCEDAVLHIRPLRGTEAVFHGDDYEEGYDEGFDDGYNEALWENGLLSDDEDEEDEVEDEDECGSDNCDYCEYYCHHCKKCVLDTESEVEDHE